MPEYPYETDEQWLFLTWLRREHPAWADLTYAIPNAAKRGRVSQQEIYLLGLRKGIPDLHIAAPAIRPDGGVASPPMAHGPVYLAVDGAPTTGEWSGEYDHLIYLSMYIEMKRVREARPKGPSKEQQDRICALRRAGHAAVVAYGHEEARRFFGWYKDGLLWLAEGNWSGYRWPGTKS